MLLRFILIASLLLLTGCSFWSPEKSYEIYNQSGLPLKYDVTLINGSTVSGHLSDGLTTKLILPGEVDQIIVYSESYNDSVLDSAGELYKVVVTAVGTSTSIPKPGGDNLTKILAEIKRIRSQGWPLPSKVKVIWPSFKTDCQAFYCPDFSRSPNVIHLQTSELVNGFYSLWHELGHAVMDAVYRVPYGRGCPSLHYNTEPSSLECAWSEGWATFFALVIGQTSVWCWASGHCINYESDLDSLWTNQRALEIEGFVTLLLWDLWDDYQSDDEEGATDFANMWKAFQAQPQTLEEFLSILGAILGDSLAASLPNLPRR